MRISDIRTLNRNGLSRVSACIDNVPLWFESSDAELQGIPEVYGSAMLFSSLAHNDTLCIQNSVSPKWAAGIEQLLLIFNRWWKLPILPPQAPIQETVNRTPLPATATCFTGGVDSFYTLLHSKHDISHIVFAHGFDIPLEDETRMSAFEQSMREVSQSLGVKPIVVRTNLRNHPAYSCVGWEQSHGSAIASIGYLLSNEIGTLIIPSSYTYADKYPWGTSWLIDSLWSTERLNVLHDDATYRRTDKLKHIVNEQLVRRHLRVCHENRSPTGNCSVCEKCVRTMIAISVWARLEEFSVFDHSIPLVKRIDQLAFISPHIEVVYNDFLSRDISSDLKMAIVRLIKRSHDLNEKRKYRRMGKNMIHWAWKRLMQFK